MAISFIGQASSSLTTITPPSHQAGDLFLILGFRDGSNSTPTKPLDYAQLQTVTSNSAGSMFAYKLATSSGESGGTWANATGLILLVYRGVDQVTPIGGSSVSTASSTTVSYPAVPMSVTNGSSYIAGLAASRSIDTSIETPPSGMTNRVDLLDATDEIAGHDTNGGVTGWPTTTVAIAGTSSGWAAFTAEILVPKAHYLNNRGVRPRPFAPGLAR